MKRLIAVIVALLMICALPIFPDTTAAAETKLGELLITSEKVTGAVGDVVKVNFFLYANLPDGRKLDSLTGSMRYDPDVVKLGAVNQVDEENNLTSLMRGKASSFQYNIEGNGVLRFAFIDAYGVEANGFWFQAEFRIEAEGSTDFVFNGITYTGIDSSFKTETYYIEPTSVGGIYTEGQDEPENGPVEETFAPLTPAVETPKPATPTPKPSNSSKPVPVTSTLPTYSAKPAPSGIVTPGPAVTSMPLATNSGETAATPAPDDQAQNTEATPEAGTDPVAEVPGGDTTEAPAIIEDTPAPIRETEETDPTPAPQQGGNNGATGGEESMNLPLVIGVIAGIVVVIALGVLAIVLVLKRRNAGANDDEANDDEDED